MEITNIRKEVEDSGKEYSYRLLHDTVRLSEADDSNKLSDSSKNSIRQLECLHSANGAPFCFEERMVNIGSVPEIEDVAFDQEGPGNWLQRTARGTRQNIRLLQHWQQKQLLRCLELSPARLVWLSNEEPKMTWETSLGQSFGMLGLTTDW